MKTEVLFLKVPVSDGSLGRNEGTDSAPDAIAEKLVNQEFEEITRQSFGEMQKKTCSKAKELMKEKTVFSLGGDHSIVYPLAKAFTGIYEEPSLIIFDAHADCYEMMKPTSNEDYVNVLIQENLFKGKNILEVGVRHTWPEEEIFIKEKGINVIRADALKNSFEDSAKKINEFCTKAKNIYLSIDFDVLDKEIAFATGYPEDNGLSLEELNKLTKIVLESRKVKAIDFCEYNPSFDKEEKGLNISLEIINSALNYL